MIPIAIAFSNKEHTGSRAPRFENEENEYDYRDFKNRAKKKSRKPRTPLAIPRRGELTEEHMRVTRVNWLSRRERSRRRKSRIDGMRVTRVK